MLHTLLGYLVAVLFILSASIAHPGELDGSATAELLTEIEMEYPFFVGMLTPRISYDTVERQYMRREPRKRNIKK